ncbi:MAG: tetratricopeptide repeat protein [Candidatus Taylorbacteria bacterium]
MNQDNFNVESASVGAGVSPVSVRKSGMETIGYYVLLVSLILSPIIFWPSTYIAVDTIKTIVIGLGILIGAVMFGLNALVEKRLVLPPRQIFWTSILMIVSLFTSSIMSVHAVKSIFGQGFETITTSFIATIFLAGLLIYTMVQRKLERAVVLYVGIFSSYLVIFLYQVLRLIFGSSFATFSIFSTPNSTLLGNWLDLGVYSMIILLVSICAIVFLKLSAKMKILYWILAVASLFTALIVNNTHVWSIAFIVLLGFTIFGSTQRIRRQNLGFMGSMKKLTWIPLIACVFMGLLVWKGNSIAGSLVSKLNVPYSEMALPWQLTLDVASGAIKQSPMLGVGNNHFLDAYLTNKPDAVNMSDAWGVDFHNGFGYIPTLIAEQGVIGLILWILFFIFLGILGVRSLKNMKEDSSDRFIIISSFVSAVFLWLITVVSVPSHVILLLTFVMTGIFLGASVFTGSLRSLAIEPKSGSKQVLLQIILVVSIIIAIIWSVIYVKKLVALSYFGAGVKQLTTDNLPKLALISFNSAYNVDHLDVYLQGKTEAGITMANAIASQAGTSTNASSTEILVKQFTEVVSAALIDARAAVASDPSDYYNYVSEARVSELATSIKMENAYDNAVAAYGKAIALNPKNPSLYLNLAKLQVGQEKLDDSLKSIGEALKVKPNYLDAVFLLSQVYAAKGDLPNGIIAAKFATQLNPQSSQVFFQLGLLQYNNKDYASAVTSFETATKLQADYANAQYFLGLSYARVDKIPEAIVQFQALAKANPDNQEVATTLKNLGLGKSIFETAKAATSPEKASSLPIKTKK